MNRRCWGCATTAKRSPSPCAHPRRWRSSRSSPKCANDNPRCSMVESETSNNEEEQMSCWNCGQNSFRLFITAQRLIVVCDCGAHIESCPCRCTDAEKH